MTLVLIHAFPLDHRLWQPVANIVSSAGIDVRSIDLPGFAGTALPVGPPDLRAVAADVLTLLPPECAVAGVSLGGYVVMELLRTPAARPILRGVALCDTKASADSPTAQSNRLAMAQAAQDQPHEIGDVLVASLLPSLVGADPDPFVVDQVAAWLREASADSVAWYQRAMAIRPDSHADLAAFDGPSLVLWGEQDVLSPRADQQSMLEALANPTAVCIPKAGHLACLEDPQQTADALISWVSGIG